MWNGIYLWGMRRDKGIVLPGGISYGPRAMPHLIHFMLYTSCHDFLPFLLPYIIYFLFYTRILLHGYIYPPRPVTMSAGP